MLEAVLEHNSHKVIDLQFSVMSFCPMRMILQHLISILTPPFSIRRLCEWMLDVKRDLINSFIYKADVQSHKSTWLHSLKTLRQLSIQLQFVVHYI